MKNDPRIPLNYRGISLLSTVYKVYSNILNYRLIRYLEMKQCLVDEQNGFRKHRASVDHIHSVSTIIRARIATGKPTFSCFVDFQ